MLLLVINSQISLETKSIAINIIRTTVFIERIPPSKNHFYDLTYINNSNISTVIVKNSVRYIEFSINKDLAYKSLDFLYQLSTLIN